MKKIFSYFLTFILAFTAYIGVQNDPVDATPGMLKQKTVRKCKGKWYGKHKKHWHKAKKGKKNKKWYAKGKSLGSKKPKACR